MQSKIKSDVSIKAKVAVIITNQDGSQERRELGDNTACQAYLNAIASWTAGVNNTGQNPVSPPTQFELGTGTGTPAVSDASLFTPATGTLSVISARSAVANTTTLTTNYAVGQLSGTYTEAGLLGAGGALLNHVVFQTPVSVDNTQAATFIWSDTINAG